MGGDQIASLPKWKHYQKLLSENEIVIYKRSDEDQLPKEWNSFAKHITLLDVPLFPISSTLIRQKVKAKKSIHYLVPEKVEQYILSSGYYKWNTRGIWINLHPKAKNDMKSFDPRINRIQPAEDTTPEMKAGESWITFEVFHQKG